MEAGADVRDLLGLWRVPERARRFLERYVRMMVSYQPRPYAGTVTLLRARTRSLTYTGDSDLGWSKLATGVSVHSVPGAHDTILKEPRVRDLAAALSAQLERASLRRNGAAVTGRSLRD
jgi:thioesterase domain-containing protein